MDVNSRLVVFLKYFTFFKLSFGVLTKLAIIHTDLKPQSVFVF